MHPFIIPMWLECARSVSSCLALAGTSSSEPLKIKSPSTVGSLQNGKYSMRSYSKVAGIFFCLKTFFSPPLFSHRQTVYPKNWVKIFGKIWQILKPHNFGIFCPILMIFFLVKISILSAVAYCTTNNSIPPCGPFSYARSQLLWTMWLHM